MWQERFAKHKRDGFTVVCIAMDAEGAAVAKPYYDLYKVECHTLVDPNYALGFAVIPHTFFIDEHGKMLEPKASENWASFIVPADQLKPVTDEIRKQWRTPGETLDPQALAEWTVALKKNPADLKAATELASRYLAAGLTEEAKTVLAPAVKPYDPKAIATKGGAQAKLLSDAYLQLMRACKGDREAQVRHAKLSYFLSPTIGFGKQITRIMEPDKFDNRPDHKFDNDYRQATSKELKQERATWLAQ